MAASGVASVASVAKAASAPIAASTQPVVIVVQSLPSAGVLPLIQVFGTLIIAAIAAWITWSMQRRQVAIAVGSLKTANNKLRFELFERRLDIFEAGLGLLTDQYLDDEDPNPEGDYSRLAVLVKRTTGAGWLTDNETQTFLVQLARSANVRYQGHSLMKERTRKAWHEKGWHVTEEVQADRDRQGREQQRLIDLFHKFLQIDH